MGEHVSAVAAIRGSPQVATGPATVPGAPPRPTPIPGLINEQEKPAPEVLHLGPGQRHCEKFHDKTSVAVSSGYAQLFAHMSPLRWNEEPEHRTDFIRIWLRAPLPRYSAYGSSLSAEVIGPRRSDRYRRIAVRGHWGAYRCPVGRSVRQRQAIDP
jgi:hypothetical protein